MEEVKKQEMESLFCPYEVALALKELGFDFEDDDILGFYSIKYGVTIHQQLTKNDGYNPAILYQQAFRWFREKYKVDSIIQPTYSTKYQYRMFHIEGKTKVQIYGEYMGKEFKTYEEAELACLNKLIEIVKQK